MINSKKIINKEDILIKTFVIYFYSTCIIDIMRLLGQSYLPILNDYIEIIRNVLYISILFIILGIIIIWHDVKKIYVYMLYFFIFFILLSIALNNNVLKLIGPFLVYFISRCLVGLYLTLHIKNYKKMLLELDKFKIIGIPYAILIIIVYSNLNDAYSKSSYMAISYNLLQIAMVAFIGGVYLKQNKNMIYHIFLVAVILVYGARGTLVCLGVFYLTIYCLKEKSEVKKKKLPIYLIIGYISFIIILNLNNILTFMEKKFSFSRNLSLINAESLFDFSNRTGQYEKFIREILDNPFSFRGVLSDRFYMAEIFNYEPVYNVYPHNLFLELFYQVGTILGIIVIALILWKIINKIKIIKKVKRTELFIFVLFIPVPFVYLMFSGSYLISYTFWMGIGYLFNRKRGNL